MQVASSFSRLLASALSIALAVAFSSAVVRGDESSAALKALEGIWTAANGQVDADWTIKGDSFTAKVQDPSGGGEMKFVGKVAADADAKPHAAITIEIKEGPGEYVGRTVKGIYKLEADKLVVNVAVPGRDRPADFTPDGEDVILFEMTRQAGAK